MSLKVARQVFGALLGGAVAISVLAPTVAASPIRSDDDDLSPAPMQAIVCGIYETNSSMWQLISDTPGEKYVPLCAAHPSSIGGFALSRHASTRMYQRGISTANVRNSLRGGVKEWSARHGSSMYMRAGVCVAVKNGVITTVYWTGSASCLSSGLLY